MADGCWGVSRAAWTGKELREILNKLGDDVAVEIDPAELALTERPQDQEEMAKARVKKRCVDMLRKKLKANEKEGGAEGAGKTLALRFCLSPTELLVPPPAPTFATHITFRLRNSSGLLVAGCGVG